MKIRHLFENPTIYKTSTFFARKTCYKIQYFATITLKLDSEGFHLNIKALASGKLLSSHRGDACNKPLVLCLIMCLLQLQRQLSNFSLILITIILMEYCFLSEAWFDYHGILPWKQESLIQISVSLLIGRTILRQLEAWREKPMSVMINTVIMTPETAMRYCTSQTL